MDRMSIRNLSAAGTMGERLPAPSNQSASSGRAPRATDDPVGEIDTVGSIWYDYQHNGSVGRMIVMDPQGNIHVDWMNGLDNGATQRHIYYNLRDSAGIWHYGSVGQEVATLVDGNLMAGQYEAPFDGSDRASGVYFYRLTSTARTEARKMVLLK